MERWNRLKVKQYDGFRQLPLLKKTLVILESHHFRLQARRFVLDLFDKGLMRQMVLEEDASSEESDATS